VVRGTTRLVTYGGFVIPCFEPVLMIMALFSWCTIDCIRIHPLSAEQVHRKDGVPGLPTVPARAGLAVQRADPSIVQEHRNLSRMSASQPDEGLHPAMSRV
jgi:hypothetical protein